MVRSYLPEFFIGLVKLVGDVVRDTLIEDYRITVIIEKKIDDKTGVVVESLSVNKRMSKLDADSISKKVKELIETKGEK